MPLHLVTGPANSGRAGVVLGGYRRRLDEEPVLVVPFFQDVEHNQRELAEKGAVLGANVVRFSWLFELIARRTGYSARVASILQRELIVEDAVRGSELRSMAASAARPGFARAAARFVTELGGARVEPDDLRRSLAEWAGNGPRRAYADDVASLYEAYRDGLDRARVVDEPLYRRRALDALRRDPDAWGGSPVFFYGFDDFTPLELDAVETLAREAGADVTVSLPYEPGHPAFKAIASTYEDLRALADRHDELEAISDHYAGESRVALHHVERSLYRAEERLDPGDAVRLHSAGGERAEVEQVARAALDLVRSGTHAGQIAVVFRDPGRYGSLIEQVFGAYGVPFSINRRVRFEHTALGRGLAALLRCALPEGRPDDLVTYLRTAGKLRVPGFADDLEFDIRKEGTQELRRARTLWEQAPKRWQLDEIDRLRDADDDLARLDTISFQLERLFTDPHRRRARILEGPELDDARAFRVAQQAIAGMRRLAESGAVGELGLARIREVLCRELVRLGENPQPDRVQISDPGGIRARRFQAVFVCGLQEGEFPRPGRPDPFLPDEDRRAIAEASGLRLPVREDQLERERYLFYVCASRAERLLVLSSRTSDEEGAPQVPSFLVEDVRDLFTDALGERALRRDLADVTWPLETAPTEQEWLRAAALAGPRRENGRPRDLSTEQVLRSLREREHFSASSLEAYADCPVKWLMDNVLRPDALEPDPEQMVRGSFAHAVLERTYRELKASTGSARVTRDSLPEAERIALDAMKDARGQFQLSPKETRVRTAYRRLEFDLLRYLRHEAEIDGDFEPAELEMVFEGVEIGGVSIRGKVDRVDTWGEFALVRDYKSGKTVFPVAQWEDKHRMQAAIYMLAVERALGKKPAGGVYVPLGGSERRPRGMLRKDLHEALGSDWYDTDFRDDAEFEEQLERVEQTVAELVEAIRAGRMRPCPESCSWRGGCSHPSICREEA